MIPATPPSGHIDVIALVRGRERYIWLYRPDQVIDLFSSFGTYAALPCYSFTWKDAENLRARVNADIAKQAEAGR